VIHVLNILFYVVIYIYCCNIVLNVGHVLLLVLSCQYFLSYVALMYDFTTCLIDTIMKQVIVPVRNAY